MNNYFTFQPHQNDESSRLDFDKLRDEENARKEKNHTKTIYQKIKKLKATLLVGLLWIAIIAIAAVLFYKIGLPLAKYGYASILSATGHYGDAVSIFEDLDDNFMRCQKEIDKCYSGNYGKDKWAEYKELKAGDSFYFGCYEQDANLLNGKEPIEWIVLEKEGMDTWLISKNALDSILFNDIYTETNWEKSTIRKWLNNHFCQEAFDDVERSCLEDQPTQYYWSEENPESNHCVFDQVFLLSKSEIEESFKSDTDRICMPTPYATQKSKWQKENEPVRWWTRSTTNIMFETTQTSVTLVTDEGSINTNPTSVITPDIFVRPAIHLNFAL